MASERDRDELLDELAESFVERWRQGERPKVAEYVSRYPGLADEIRTMFATMAKVEQIDIGDSSPLSPLDTDSGPELTEVGDYRVIREVGRGGMGIVYEAEQISLGRRVALKVLPRPALVDPRQRTRFQREAQSAAKLQHPNIVPVFGVGEHEGVMYFAMQFIQGQGLHDVLTELRRIQLDPKVSAGSATQKPDGSIADGLLSGAAALGHSANRDHDATELPSSQRDSESSGSRSTSDSKSGWDKLPGISSSSTSLTTGSSTGSRVTPFYRSVAQIGVQSSEALHYAHEQRVLHRDVKPSNMLLDLHGNVWLTDFGLAKDETADELTHTGDLVGTLRYMAPERFRGWADPRSDVYSLGLTIYELLTLQPAFDSRDRGLLVKQVTQDEPARPRRVDSGIPRDLETIVLKSIAKEPAQRYRTAGDMASDLRRFLAGKPIHARRTPVRERLWLWYLRNPMVANLMLVVMFLLSIGSVALTWATLHFQNIASTNEALLRDNESLLDAELEARRIATERLYDSRLAQAHGYRWSRRQGQREESLKGLLEAAELAGELGKSPEDMLDLGNAAIACMPLVDIARVRDIEIKRSSPGAFGPSLNRYAQINGKLVTVRSTRDGHELHRAMLEEEHRWSLVRFSRDGNLLGVYSKAAREFRAVDLKEDRTVLRAPAYGGGYLEQPFAFSPDGRTVAVILDHEIRIYRVGVIKPRSVIPTRSQANRVQFSPDGQRVAAGVRLSGNRAEVRIYDITDPSEMVRLILKGPSSAVSSIAWAPDSKRIALSAVPDNRFSMWDAQTAREQATFIGHAGDVVGLTFTEDGATILSNSSDGTTRVWDVATGINLLQFPALGGPHKIAADGQSFVIESRDTSQPAAVYRLVRSPEFQLLSDSTRITGFGNDWSFVHNSSGLQIRDGTTEVLGRLPFDDVAKAIEDRSGILTAGPRGISHWPIRMDPDDNQRTIGPPTMLLPIQFQLRQFDISRSGDVLAAVQAPDGPVHVTNPDTPGTVKLTLRHLGVRYASVSPEGKWIATGAWQKPGLKIWDARSGRLLKDLAPRCSWAKPCFSADGRWLASAIDTDYMLWDVHSSNPDDWELQRRWPRANRGTATVRFSRNGLMTFIVGRAEAIKLVEAESGRELASFSPAYSEHQISGLFLSPNADYLCVTYPGLQELWNLSAVRRTLRLLNLDWHRDYEPGDESERAQPQGPRDRWTVISNGVGPEPVHAHNVSIVPAGGAFRQPRSVELKSNISSTTLHYTVNGADPTTESSRYDGPITIDATTTLKVLATTEEGLRSSIASARYFIHKDAVPLANDAWTVWDVTGPGVHHPGSRWITRGDAVVQRSNIWDGVMRDTSPHTRRKGTLRIYQGASEFRDGELSLQVQSPDDDAFGIAIRLRDPDHCYLFAMNRQRRYRILALVNGPEFTVLDQNSKHYDLERWHHVRIVAAGGRLQVFVDGEKDLEATDSTLAEGSVALYSWGSAGVTFRDITLNSD